MENKIFAVGIGPGDLRLLTPQAMEVLQACTVVAGYPPYLDLIAPLLEGKKLIPGGMRQEVERCTRALETVLEGETVAVVSSGDAGVYGMAGLLLELTQEERFSSVEVEIIPGITAALSCAALVGAPFANDAAFISLSDLMTPAAVIRKRLAAIASADMPAALYNPASRRRHDLLEFAVETFFRAGGPLPGALVSDAYRPSREIEFFTLDRFPFEQVRMTTLVIIGNSQFEVNRGKLFCRRGYREKYGVGQ